MRKLILPKAQIIELYNQGNGCYKIAKEYMCSASTINNYLKQWGINTKKTPTDYKINSVDENYFEKIDTEKKAYFLGLFYADGCVSNNSVNISLMEEDGYILEKLKQDCKSTYDIYTIPKRKENHKNQKCFLINNINFKNNLIKNGCIERKSLVLTFPDEKIISKEFKRHFIRGFIDGDGSIGKSIRSINEKEYVECFINVVSSVDFIKKLSKEIEGGSTSKINKGKNAILTIKSKKELLKLISFLYKDSTIYLDRKYKKAEEIKDILENKKFFYNDEIIKQYTTEGVFVKEWESIREIKDKTNYNHQTILRNIKGQIKTANKFVWKIE